MASRRPSSGGRLSLKLVAPLGAAALALALAASVAVGTAAIPLEATVTALTDYDASRAHVIVTDVRLPRTLIAAAVGAALGVAGAVMQALSRNPLAEPGILGVSWGAALAAVAAQVVLGVGSFAGVVWLALAGAACAGLVVVGFASVGRSGHGRGNRARANGTDELDGHRR